MTYKRNRRTYYIGLNEEIIEREKIKLNQNRKYLKNRKAIGPGEFALYIIKYIVVKLYCMIQKKI